MPSPRSGDLDPQKPGDRSHKVVQGILRAWLIPWMTRSTNCRHQLFVDALGAAEADYHAMRLRYEETRSAEDRQRRTAAAERLRRLESEAMRRSMARSWH